MAETQNMPPVLHSREPQLTRYSTLRQPNKKNTSCDKKKKKKKSSVGNKSGGGGHRNKSSANLLHIPSNTNHIAGYI